MIVFSYLTDFSIFFCEKEIPKIDLFTIILIIVREYLSKTFLDHIQIKIPTA
jgi:hypothetical protein